MTTKKKIESVAKKKMGIGTRELTPKKSWGLVDYLLAAVDKTCRRMGKTGEYERYSDTFCKVSVGDSAVIFLDSDSPMPYFAKSLPPHDDPLIRQLVGEGRFVKAQIENDVLVKAIEAQCASVVKTQIGLPSDAGHNRLDEQERAMQNAKRKRTVARANELRKKDPQKTWKTIAREIGVPERTLRDWRHNPIYK